MRIARFLLVIPIVLGLVSCVSTRSADGGLAVVATFYPLAFVADYVAGEHADIVQIVPGGVEPHDYEPTPEQLQRIYDADVFILNGGGIDPWAERVAGELAAKGARVVIAVDSLPVLPVEDAGHEEEHDDHAGGYDPHVWLDPVLMQNIVVRVADAIAIADPVHAGEYRIGADMLQEELRSADQAYRDGLATCTVRDFVTAHGAFRYLAERYDLTMHAIAGLSPDDDPSPKHLAELADLLREKRIETVFFESLTSPRLADTLAREVGAATAVLNPIEGLTHEESEKGETYLTLLSDNLGALRAALQCP